MLVTKKLYIFIALTVLCFKYSLGYRKYYIEDECIPSSKKQKIILRLPATGPDSVGEIRSNRFGTYSRTERNCAFKLKPPNGYGVVLTLLKIDFRDTKSCKDFIKILTSDDEEKKLCGYKEFGAGNQTSFTDEELTIVYHTSASGMGFNNGVRLIFTVTKLNEDACSTPAEFQCHNAHCIWAGVTCDGINNCGDGSDENLSDYPYCRTYSQIYKNLFSLLDEITPLAITAVVLGIASFVAVIIGMCICCCRPAPEKIEKPILFQKYTVIPNGGYNSLPAYNYGSTGNTFSYMQPVLSSVHPSAPMQFSLGCANSNVPLLQQKVEIRYERPPPPYES